MKLLALIRDGKDRVETANLNLHTYMVRLKRYNTELKLRGGAEAIGGDDDDNNGNVSTMIGNTDDVSDGEN